MNVLSGLVVTVSAFTLSAVVAGCSADRSAPGTSSHAASEAPGSVSSEITATRYCRCKALLSNSDCNDTSGYAMFNAARTDGNFDILAPSENCGMRNGTTVTYDGNTWSALLTDVGPDRTGSQLLCLENCAAIFK